MNRERYGEWNRPEVSAHGGSEAGRSGQIERDHWSRFLNDFSKEHEGAPATVAVRTADRESSHEVCHGMPLVGVTFSPKDNPELIEIVLEESPEGGNLTHVIPTPVHVWRVAGNRGCDQLEIVASDGSVTLLQLA